MEKNNISPASVYVRIVMKILPSAIYTARYVRVETDDSPRNTEEVYYLHTSIIEDYIDDKDKERLMYHLAEAYRRDNQSLDKCIK